MAELYLIRHGQASFGTDDYDRLSLLGEQQSRWLGEYFAARGETFHRVYCGTLQRQRATVRAIGEGLGTTLATEEHAGFNEYDFGALVERYRELADAEAPPLDDHTAYYRLLKRTLIAWSAGELDGGPCETWEAFRDRAAQAIARLQRDAATGERVLVVSSGGPIAAMLGAVLELADTHAIELNLQLYNTSVSRLFFNDRRMVLAGFNAVPHLDTPARRDAISYG